MYFATTLAQTISATKKRAQHVLYGHLFNLLGFFCHLDLNHGDDEVMKSLFFPEKSDFQIESSTKSDNNPALHQSIPTVKTNDQNNSNSPNDALNNPNSKSLLDNASGTHCNNKLQNNLNYTLPNDTVTIDPSSTHNDPSSTHTHCNNKLQNNLNYTLPNDAVTNDPSSTQSTSIVNDLSVVSVNKNTHCPNVNNTIVSLEHKSITSNQEELTNLTHTNSGTKPEQPSIHRTVGSSTVVNSFVSPPTLMSLLCENSNPCPNTDLVKIISSSYQMNQKDPCIRNLSNELSTNSDITGQDRSCKTDEVNSTLQNSSICHERSQVNLSCSEYVEVSPKNNCNEVTNNINDSQEEHSVTLLQSLPADTVTPKNILQPVSHVEGLHPVSKVEGLHHVSQVEGLRPVSQVEGLHPVSHVEGLHPVSQVEGLHPVSQVEGLRPVSQVEGSLDYLHNIFQSQVSYLRTQEHCASQSITSTNVSKLQTTFNDEHKNISESQHDVHEDSGKVLYCHYVQYLEIKICLLLQLVSIFCLFCLVRLLLLLHCSIVVLMCFFLLLLLPFLIHF